MYVLTDHTLSPLHFTADPWTIVSPFKYKLLCNGNKVPYKVLQNVRRHDYASMIPFFDDPCSVQNSESRLILTLICSALFGNEALVLDQPTKQFT